MVEPEDDVAIVIEFRTGNRDGFVGVLGEDRKRACGIKSHALYHRGVDVVLVQDTLYGGTDASPNIVSRLFLHRISVAY